MNDFATGAQIVVSKSAFVQQLGSVVRAALTYGAGYLAAKGWLDDGLAMSLVPLLLMGGSLAWAAFRNWRSQQVKIALAERLPDAVAVVK